MEKLEPIDTKIQDPSIILQKLSEIVSIWQKYDFVERVDPNNHIIVIDAFKYAHSIVGIDHSKIKKLLYNSLEYTVRFCNNYVDSIKEYNKIFNKYDFEIILNIFIAFGRCFTDKYFEFELDIDIDNDNDNDNKILIIDEQYIDNITHYFHRIDGPCIIARDIYRNIIEEIWLHNDLLKRNFAYFDKSIFYNPNEDEPVYRSFKYKKYGILYIEFYCKDTVVARNPYNPSITIKYTDSSEIKIYTSDEGEPIAIEAINKPYKTIIFHSGKPIYSDKLHNTIRNSTIRPYYDKDIIIYGIFEQIIWTDGTIFQRVDDDTYHVTYTTGIRKWFKNTFNKKIDYYYIDYYQSQIYENYLKIKHITFKDILHRIEYRRDEDDGSEYLLPAIEYPDGTDKENEFWVNGKKVTWNWQPIRSTSKQRHKIKLIHKIKKKSSTIT